LVVRDLMDDLTAMFKQLVANSRAGGWQKLKEP
jgi:hypothetical protein